ncbi:hypothetical protein AgCh_024248 [Apium graveolens]
MQPSPEVPNNALHEFGGAKDSGVVSTSITLPPKVVAKNLVETKGKHALQFVLNGDQVVNQSVKPTITKEPLMVSIPTNSKFMPNRIVPINQCTPVPD